MLAQNRLTVSGSLLATVLAALLAAPDVEAARPARWRFVGADPGHTGAAAGGPLEAPALAWKLPANSPLLPLTADGDLLFTSHANSLRAVDITSGKVAWEGNLTNVATSGPVVVGERVVVAIHPGFLIAVSRKTGKEIWRAETRLPVGGAPVAAGKLLLAEATADGSPRLESRLLALNSADGVQRWLGKYNLGARTSPAVAGNTALVGRINSLDAFDLRTGARRWSVAHRGPQPSSPVTNGSIVWFTVTNGTTSQLRAIDLKTGVAAWPQDIDFDAPVSMPALAGDKVLVGVGGKGLVAYAAATGKELWTAPAAGLVEGQPVAGSKLAYWVAGSTLVAVSLVDGAPAWSVDLGARGGQLILAGDTLVATTLDRSLGGAGALLAYR